MEFDQFKESSIEEIDTSINFKEILGNYLKYWKWYVVSILMLVTLAFLLLRKQAPRYEINSTILLNDVSRSASKSDLDVFAELGLYSSNTESIDNEIHLLTSRRLMENVVTDLYLNIRYYLENDPYDIELFPNYPISINFIENKVRGSSKVILVKSNSLNLDMGFKVKIKSKEKFELFDLEGKSYGIKGFDRSFIFEKQKIKLELNETNIDSIKEKFIIIDINPVVDIANLMIKKITVEPVDDRSRVLNLSIREEVIDKGIAILTNLVEQYNEDGINEKNRVHEKTVNFLNNRLDILYKEITAIENTAVQYQTRSRMVGTSSRGEVYLNSSSENEGEMLNANTQLQLINYVLEEIESRQGFTSLPVNIGLTDLSISNLIGEFNQLVLRRNRIMKSSSSENPAILSIDAELDQIKNNLIFSLNNFKKSTELLVNSLVERSNTINYRIASVPKNQKELRNIVREQETKNALYLNLLEKREELLLSQPINVKNAKVIDKAYSDGRKVSPKKKITYFASLLIGLLIPTLIIYIINLLDSKVRSEKDLIKLNIPIIGEIPLNETKNILIKDRENSNQAEAFRYLRTSIINLKKYKNEYGKTIFVTSTVKGEGKTITSINLAISLAISGKKTLLLGMDLRSPKISNYLDIDGKLGVTNFIKKNNFNLKKALVNHPLYKNLDILNSGSIPPNPVELLMNSRVRELFDELKSYGYEYIIVDTAPVGLVTDTIQLSEFADYTIYVVKANFLDKKMLRISENLKKNNKLKNITFLLNAIDFKRAGYGGYGYGYGNIDNIPWYKKLFS